MKKLTYFLGIILASCLVLLSNCKDDDPVPVFYTVGGTVSGLAESAFLIIANGEDEMTITENGPFTFPTEVMDGETYSVTVTSDPIGQSSSVESATGTVMGGSVTGITITCINDLYTIGGTISGLSESGSIVLMNGTDEITVTEDGPFTFPTEVENGGSYEITVKTDPAGQTSTVENGTGIVNVADVTNISVTCTNIPIETYLIAGTASGLTGGTLVLVNGEEEVSVTEDGTFVFPTPIPDGSTYDIKVKTDPEGQQTTITNGIGVVSGANVTDITATCADLPADSYLIGGNITGLNELNEATLVLANGSDELTITSDGPFAFPTPVANGTTYNVIIKTQPVGGFCTIQNGEGTVDGANASDIVVTCEVNEPIETYRIGGMVTGISGGTLVLLNGEEELSIVEDGAFSFPTPVADGTAYDIKVKSEPEGQNTTIENATGTVDGANVENIAVTCTDLPPTTFLVGGTVTGLAGGTLILANGEDELQITTDGPFTFQTAVADGGTYNVTIKSQPSGGFCTIENGSGTVTGANVSNVAVTCDATPTYTVGGTISGLTGTLVIANNGVNELTITQNGPFTFTTPLATGSNYVVSIVMQPSGELCSIQNGTGTVDGANVTDVTISCVSNPDIGTNYFAVDASDPAIFYEFQNDQSLLAKSVNGFGEYQGIVGLAYDADNDILYAYSSAEKKLFTVNRTTGVATAIADLATSELYDLAYDKNADKLYAVNFFSGILFSIDVTSGAMTEVNSNASLIQVYGLAYDPENDKLYGTKSGKLIEIGTTSAGAVTEIGTLATGLISGLAYDTDNDVLFGATGGPLQDLYQISSADASATEIGKTGLPGLSDGGMTYVDGDDQLIASTGLGNGKVYEVDRTSGSTTSIGSSGYPAIRLAYSDMDQLVYGLSADPSGINVLLSINEDNGTSTFKTEVGLNNGFILLGFTYDDEMDDFYTIVEDGQGEHLASIDRTTGDVEKRLAVLDDNELKALAFDKENNILYGMTTKDLVIINASSGVIITEIDVDGLSGEVLAMNYDPVNKVLVATTDSRNVIAIDPLTGDSNEIAKTDVELFGITLRE